MPRNITTAARIIERKIFLNIDFIHTKIEDVIELCFNMIESQK